MSSVSYDDESYKAKFEGEGADLAGKKQLIVVLTTDKGLCGCTCRGRALVCCASTYTLSCRLQPPPHSCELHHFPHDRRVHGRTDQQGVPGVPVQPG